MGSRDPLSLAKQHLQRARNESDDADEVFLWGFYCLENAVVAAAEAAGVPCQASHRGKAQAAKILSEREGLADVSDFLSALNEARKQTAYGDVDETELDPAEVLDRLGEYVQNVEELVAKKRQ